jgi:Integrase core domain.
MKNSQTLSQYALLWVHYFDDEANVNGIEYSKFRQYCYFVDGITLKFSVVKKFLEMEFTIAHDRKNNIPISLELRNLPSTIVSLCNVHGIFLAAPIHSNIQFLENDTNLENCHTDNDAIKKIQSHQAKKLSSSLASSPPNDPKVQCWLCDGPHSFRQCQELVRIKGVCAQRPQVRKHFHQLLLQKSNGFELKVLLDAPELFDDPGTSPPSDSNQNDDVEDTATHDHVNSLQILSSDLFTTFTNEESSSNIATFPESTNVNRQLACDNDPDDEESLHNFYILSLSDSTDASFVPIHPADVQQIAEEIEAIDRLSVSSNLASPYDYDSLCVATTATLNDVTHQDDCHDFIHSVSFADSSPSNAKFRCFTTQVDGGANRCTTPHRNIVENIRPPDPKRGEPLFIYDAGKHRHTVEGVGDFRIESWIDGKISRTLTIPCVYIPTIPSTLVNFRLVSNMIMYGEVSNLVTNEAIGTLIVGSPNDYVVHKIPLKLRGNRVYASNLLSFGDIHSDALVLHDQVAIVSDEATRILWHARLGHLNFRALSSMHLSAKGIPKFKQSHVTDQCETCLETKLRRSPRGHGSIVSQAEVHGQILCGDWGFICQKSSDPTRITQLASVHGDTSYLIFVCANTGALYGVCGGSKSVPTKWLHIFLHRVAYSAGRRPKTVLIDRGSELGRSDKFRSIASIHGYKTITAGPDKSSMNSLGERPHSTIGNVIHSMLHSASLDLKYWNFAFYHFIRLFNFFPHGNTTKSPFELVYGYQPDLSLLRVFGCNVYIRPAGRRPSKLDNHVIKGKFLGYTSTLKQIYYLEDSSNKIKVAAHAHFDEGLANVPLDDLPPYARQLRMALGHSVPPADEDHITAPANLDLLSCSDRFPVTFSHKFQIKSSDIMHEFDTLGFILKDDPSLNCCFITNIIPQSTAAQYT